MLLNRLMWQTATMSWGGTKMPFKPVEGLPGHVGACWDGDGLVPEVHGHGH